MLVSVEKGYIMTMNNVFNNLGIQAAVDYGKYQTIKGEKSDFVDFLLSYDSKGAQDGDTSWLNNITSVNEDKLISITAQASAKLNKPLSISNLGNLQNSNYFDTQVTALKYQLMEGFKERIENSGQSDNKKSAEITSLYEQMQSIQLPSRFKS